MKGMFNNFKISCLRGDEEAKIIGSMKKHLLWVNKLKIRCKLFRVVDKKKIKSYSIETMLAWMGD